MASDSSCTTYIYIYLYILYICKTNYVISLIKASTNGTIRCKTAGHGRCDVCGQEILKNKIRIVDWKCETGEFGRL